MEIDKNGSWARVEAPAEEPVKPQGSWQRVAPKTHEQTFRNVVDYDPDNIAEVKTLSRKLNTTPDFVRDNMDTARKFANRPDFDVLMTEAPTLNEMAKQEYFLAVARDDIDELKKTEKVFDSKAMQWIFDEITEPTLDAFTRGIGNVNIAKLTNADKFEEAKRLSDRLPQRRGEGPTVPQWLMATASRDLGFFQKHLLTFVGEQAPIMFESFKEGQRLGLSSAMTAGTVAAAMSAGPQALAAPITIPAATAMGYTGGTAVGMFKAVAELEGGLAKFQMLSDGVPENIADTTAEIIGVANGLLEVTGWGAIFSPLLRKVFKKSVTDIAKTIATKPSMQEVVKRVGKDLGIMVGGETATETMQEINTIIGESLAKEFASPEFNTIFTEGEAGDVERQEAMAQIGQIMEEVFFGMLVTGGLASFGRIGLNHRSQKLQERAKITSEMLKELSSSVEASRLKERSPETFAEYVNRLATDRGRDALVYLDAQTVADKLEQAGVDVIQWAEQYGVDQSDLAQALSTGGSIGLNLGTAAANIGTDQNLALFQEDLTFRPQDMSQSDLATEAQVDAAVSLGLQQEYALEQERLAKSSDIDGLRQAMIDAKMPKRAAEIYSLLFGARANAWSKETGKPAAEWFARKGLTVQREAFADFEGRQTGNQLYNQQGQIVTDSEAFRNWFGDSKVVDESGAPLVVYHGTNTEFTSFDPSTIGKRDAGFFGTGFYFGADQDTALDYADTAVEDHGGGEAVAMPLYVSLKNPFIWDMSDEGSASTRQALADMGIKRDSVRGDSASLGDATERKKFNSAIRAQGHDGVVVRDEDGVREIVAFDPTQIKSVFNQGTFDSTNPNILMQSIYKEAKALADEIAAINKDDAQIVEVGEGTIAPVYYSSRTWTQTEKDQIKEIAQQMGIEESKVDKWFYDIDNAMARVLADPSLDYRAEAADLYSALKPNSDAHYTVSLDFSTLCRKRYELMATIEAIQNQLGRAIEKDDWVMIRDRLDKLGYDVSCGACYVDSKRMEAGKFINNFIQENPTEDPTQFLSQSGIDKMKRDNPELYKKFKAAIGANNAKTPESRTDYHGEIRWYFLEGREQDSKETIRTGKAVWTNTENEKRAKERVERTNQKSGLRWQSWSDFEVPHLMDAMQAILDMRLAGLKGHAYTKVVDFVEAMGRTGLMINMSLIPKGNGFDANGNLLFDSKEGMAFEEALRLREKFPKTAGIIAIAVSNDHMKALLADPRIDYVIPYHKSGMSAQIRAKFGMESWVDFEDIQTDIVGDRELFHEQVVLNLSTKDTARAKLIRQKMMIDDPQAWIKAEKKDLAARKTLVKNDPKKSRQDEAGYHKKWQEKIDSFIKSLENSDKVKAKAEADYAKMAKAAGLTVVNFNEFWSDSRTGRENGDIFLQIARSRGIAPRFREMIYENGAVLEDVTTNPNYWKLLIDRKSFDHDGNNIVQQPVVPDYDNAAIQKIYDQASGNPTPQAAVVDVVNQVSEELGYTGPLFQSQQATISQQNAARTEAVKLRDQAEAAREEYIADVEEVAQTVNGEIPPGQEKFSVKQNIQRMIDKIISKEGKKGPKITDALRWSIVTNDLSGTPAERAEVLAKVRAEFEKKGYTVFAPDKVEDIDNLYDKDSAYKHIALKFDKGDGLIRELLIVSPSMFWAKEFFLGHKFYDVTRELDRLEKLGLLEEDVIEVNVTLKELSDLLYSAAGRADRAALTSSSSSSLSQPSIANPSNALADNFEPAAFSNLVKSILNALDAPLLESIANAVATSSGATSALRSLMGSPPLDQAIPQSVSENKRKEYPPKLENETTVEYFKRTVDKEEVPTSLPEVHGDYFTNNGDPQMIQLDRVLIEKEDRDGASAAKRMLAASEGVIPKRDPVTVRDNGDGTYTVIDGNGTVNAARMFNWDRIPVNVVDVQLGKALNLPDAGQAVVAPGQLGKGIADNSAVREYMDKITKTGKVRPIEITQDGFIVDGEHRYKAMLNLGVKEIPVFVGKQDGASGRLVKPYQGISVDVLYQGQRDPAGAIVPNPGNMQIFVFEGANLSTILHEIGHLFLFDMQMTAEQDGVMVEEWAAVKEWLGVKGDKITKAQHEKFARGFELYLREGSAPSVKLKDAFRSFRKWLTSIYKTAKELDVELTDEVRQIFDKMLATDNEIAEAKATAAMMQMFDEAFLTEQGLDEAFIRDYNEVTGRTMDEAMDKMDRHRLSGREERIRMWKEQAEKDSWLQPVYKAVYLLSRGTNPGEGGKVGQGSGISISEVIAAYGQAAYDMMPKIPGLFRTEGASIGQAAAEAGYASPQALIDDLKGMEKRTDWVESRVQQLEAEYDRTLPAEEALRNNAAAKQLEAESKVLAPFAKKTAATRKAMRMWAERMTAGQTLGKATEIYRLIQTSRKLRRQAIAAQRSGDFATAFLKNEQVRLNEELIVVHTKVRDNLKKIEKRLNARANPSLALDYRNQFNTLLQRFGLTKKQLQIDADTQTLSEFLNGLLLQGDEMATLYTPAISGWLASNKAVPYKELTWQEMQDVADLADFLYGRGKEILNDFLSDQKTKAGELAEAAVTDAKKMKGKRIFKEGSVLRRITDASRQYFAATDQLLWIFRAMDGYKHQGAKGTVGVNERQLWYRIAEAVRQKSKKMLVLTAQLKPHLDTLVAGGQNRPAVLTHMRVPEIMQADGRSWTWERVVMVAMNMGNDGNIDRLAKGFEMTVEELQTLMSIMTEQEIKAVQAIIDVIDGLFPDIDAVHRRVNHFGLKKVESSPLALAEQQAGSLNGVEIPARPAMTLRGGYFPLKYDRGLSLKMMKWGEREDILNSTEAILQTPVAKSGFTKARTGSSLPVDLSFNVIASHIHDTVQYVTHAEAIKDVDRVTQSEAYQDAAIKALGKEAYLMIRPSLKYALRPEKEFGGTLDKWIDKERVRATTFVLAWNFRTALLQPTAFTLAINRIGIPAYARGMIALASNPMQNIKFMQEISPFMLERAKNIDRDLIDARKAMQAKNRFRMSKYDRVVEAGFFPIQAMDALIAYPAWHGAYRLGLEKFDGNMDEAVLFADDAVRTSSGSGTSLDLSAMQRDMRGWMKLFTMFSSFTMGYGNMQRNSYNAWRNGALTNAEYVYDQFMTVVFPSLAMTTAFALLTTGEPPEPEDIVKDLVTWQFMGLPLVRDVVSYGIQAFPGATSVVRSPALLGTELLGKVFKDLYLLGEDFMEDGDISRKMQKRMAWDVAHLASYILKIPASKIFERIMKGIDQIEDGDGTVINLVLPDPSRR